MTVEEAEKFEKQAERTNDWRDWYAVATMYFQLGNNEKYQECIDMAADKYLEG